MCYTKCVSLSFIEYIYSLIVHMYKPRYSKEWNYCLGYKFISALRCFSMFLYKNSTFTFSASDSFSLHWFSVLDFVPLSTSPRSCPPGCFTSLWKLEWCAWDENGFNSVPRRHCCNPTLFFPKWQTKTYKQKLQISNLLTSDVCLWVCPRPNMEKQEMSLVSLLTLPLSVFLLINLLQMHM